MIEYDPKGHTVYDFRNDSIGYVDGFGLITLTNIQREMPAGVLVYQNLKDLLGEQGYYLTDRLSCDRILVSVSQDIPVSISNDLFSYEYEGSRIVDYFVSRLNDGISRFLSEYVEEHIPDFIIPGKGIEGKIILNRTKDTFHTEGFMNYWFYLLYEDNPNAEFRDFGTIQFATEQKKYLFCEEIQPVIDERRLKLFEDFFRDRGLI